MELMKYFFNSSIRQIGGLDLASQAVKAKIKALIAKENKKKPLNKKSCVCAHINLGNADSTA